MADGHADLQTAELGKGSTVQLVGMLRGHRDEISLRHARVTPGKQLVVALHLHLPGSFEICVAGQVELTVRCSRNS